ncbi:hypothetical protein OG413_39545 [Streptomyces sp. NBC_01433]|uniref:hypothetical protein n=1 Tax=Streptomyces sp. NBC_01433 TaxID=2903864 RepID=UPI0022541B13|nr:hypothetical protein [Streptomyces sp. NBC_01433]MCX4681293.1 hypothetical protein [Streptomyces sp. NBC_01433]
MISKHCRKAAKDIVNRPGSHSVSGRAHAIMMLERFIRHIRQHDDVWFATLGEIHDRWSD